MDGVSQYKALKQCLAGQPFPVTLMLGNHDRRKAFAEVFPELAAGFRHGRHRFGDTDCPILTRWMNKPTTGTAGTFASSVWTG